jgi:hypothetical protein
VIEPWAAGAAQMALVIGRFAEASLDKNSLMHIWISTLLSQFAIVMTAVVSSEKQTLLLDLWSAGEPAEKEQFHVQVETW